MKLKKGQYTYKVPKNIHEVIHANIVIKGHRWRLCNVLPAHFKQIIRKQRHYYGMPTYFSAAKGLIKICPRPDKAYELEIIYVRKAIRI